MVKKYEVEDKYLGKRYDGGKSPLSTPVVLAVQPPRHMLDDSTAFHMAAPGQWNDSLQKSYNEILEGHGISDTGGWACKKLQGWHIDPLDVPRWSRVKRLKLCNKLVAAAKIEVLNREDKLLVGLMTGVMEKSTNVEDHIIEKMFNPNYTPRERDDDVNRRERTKLHVRLRKWAMGPLVLERPTGSSLHHLADYEGGNVGRTPDDDVRRWFSDCQIVVVENDWGAAVPQIEGEWRVPFAFICWEFRISGVRVLAFTEADREPNLMWMCYGGDGHWVCDDYRYELGCPALPRGIAKSDVDAKEFRRVARMCYDTIRASCIMLDAQVAHHERVAAPAKLVQRRVAERRSPLRDHYVVRLLHAETRAYSQWARSAGAHAGEARTPQRGHWRKGTWVHYDDQDSGQVQYANDSGFLVSKTWRRWHFAGNPNDIIHKSYRL